jgi:aminoglycoside 6'-N-acetyltransferase
MNKPPGDRAMEEEISFKPLVEADFALLHQWLNQPHVKKWWDQDCSSLDRVKDKYLPRVTGRYPVQCFIMQLGARPFGYMQTYWLKDHPQYSSQLKVPIHDKVASLDLFIGEQEYLGRGLASRAIRRFLGDFVFGKMGAWECMLGPSQSNKVAINAYLAAGFKFVHIVSVLGEPEPEYLMRIARAEF